MNSTFSTVDALHINFNVRGYQIKQNTSENSGQENINNYNKF